MLQEFTTIIGNYPTILGLEIKFDNLLGKLHILFAIISQYGLQILRG